MIIENALFITPILCGPLFVLSGIILLKFPPKEINYLYGYKTKNARRNLEIWNFAQKYAAKLTIVMGSIYTFTFILAFLIEANLLLQIALAVFILFIFCYVVYFLTERKIKNKFNL